jgi:hypothetical protein
MARDNNGGLLVLQPPRTMYLREAHGNGKIGSQKISFGRIIPAGFFVEYRGRYVTVDIEKLCRGAAALIDADLDARAGTGS